MINGTCGKNYFLNILGKHAPIIFRRVTNRGITNVPYIWTTREIRKKMIKEAISKNKQYQQTAMLIGSSL